MYAVSERYMTEINNSFRKSSLYGTITTADGDTIELTNDNIVNQSVIIDKKIDTGGKLNLGGVYPAQLTIGLIGFNTTDVSGASISLTYRLWFNDTEYEDVPLGIYYVDNESIRRKKNVVTVDAFDALLKFDIETPENWGVPKLNYMVFASGDLAGVPYDIDEFNALPNATTDINLSKAVYSQIQTLRDLLMWAGQLTGSFAYIDRTGTLRFKRIQGIRDENGHVIPAREIQGNERFNTEFSDNTIRITRLTMKRGDGTVSKKQGLTAGASDENRMTLELKENPLISTVSDEDVKTMFTNILSWSDNGLSTAIFRPFTTTFFGDPALDIGDYVRLRGGEIDTTRGYATGMITSYNWQYLNNHKIECAAQSSVLKDTATETPTAKNGISTFASTSDTENKQIQVKSQLEKRVEGLESTVYGKADTQSVEQEFESRKLTNINFLEDFKAELTYLDGTSKTYTGTLEDGKLTKVSDGEKQCTVTLDSAVSVDRANDKAFAIACAVGVGGELIDAERFVAVGHTPVITTSENGKEWETKLESAYGTRAVAYGNNVLLCAGYRAYRSLDRGKTWTWKTTSNGEQLSIVYGNGLFASCGRGRRVYFSVNGTTLTEKQVPDDNETLILWAIAYGNGAFVVGGGSGARYCTIDNGVSWVDSTLPRRQNGNVISRDPRIMCGITYGDGKFVAFFAANSTVENIPQNRAFISVSEDGVNWVDYEFLGQQEKLLSVDADYTKIHYVKNQYILTIYSYTSDSVIYVCKGNDFNNWELIRPNVPISRILSIIFANGNYFAAGLGGILKSKDLKTWETIDNTKNLRGIVFVPIDG